MNHVIDPTFFYDAIEEFSFNYTLYVKSGQTVNAYGEIVNTYTTQTIRGSLQSQGLRVSRSKDGNIDTKEYNFYCKSLYRIDKDNILEYNNNFYIVNFVQDYDEWGVRNCSLEMIDLSQYKDLADYVAYLRGEKLI